MLLLFALAAGPAHAPPTSTAPAALARPVPIAPASLQWEAKLREIEQELGEAVLERRPWLLLEHGLPPGSAPPESLGRYGPEGGAWWLAKLEGAATRLQEVGPQNLSPARAAVLLSTRAWVRAELELVAAGAAERWDPTTYVERLERVLLGLVHASLDEDARRRSVLLVLEEIPSFWKTARRGLVGPSAAYSREAHARAELLAAYLQADLAVELAVVGWEPLEQQYFDRVHRAAVHTTREFRDWLIEVPVRSGGPINPLGEDRWVEALRALTGSSLSLPELRLRVLRDLAELERDLTEAPPPPDPARPPTRGALRAGIGAAARLGRIAVRPIGSRLRGEEPGVRFLPALSAAGSLARIVVEPDGSVVVALELDGTGLSPELHAARESGLGEARRLVIGTRHGAAAAAFARASRTSGTALFQNAWNRSVLDGWSLYVVSGMASADPSGESEPADVHGHHFADPAFLAETRRERRIEAALLLASLELHVAELPPDEVAYELRRRGGVDAASAAADVRRALHDPMLGSGYLVYLELFALEEAVRAAGEPLGEEEASEILRSVAALVLAHPSVRPVDLARTLTKKPAPDETGPGKEASGASQAPGEAADAPGEPSPGSDDPPGG